MYIEYNDIELDIFFNSLPNSIFDNEFDGNIFYQREEGGFKLSMYIYTYSLEVNIFLNYKNYDIVSLNLVNVSSITLSQKILTIKSNKNKCQIIFDKVFKIHNES
ncbi:hypothetical protein [Avibacterium paragallinarum]|uniref:Uncharacterized protein n=3 Tax=Avibacterium paragallinarum TaxID=728 RepID=A0AAE5TJ25_AVIPA|nr:hypothetical protein [Avibacterium paragallinarum]MEE3607466.1 hypothetical protein [Avibacterium paragallinarum]MEE3670005.1 hypothetical protein [Avibacterium paragallinarum]PXZ39873.1 hypothetical protein DM482_03835 [Avibacterium paragallinarum]PXZ41733.1 hypothetical protein DM481_05200 [Avibacterium paragallinarum]QZP14778.1 hypothetical protein K5O18_08010 [Avibacterium paragallinarum]